jgi:hypothetical protein
MATQDPLEMGYWLMDLIAKGQAASKRGDHVAALRYFAALSKAVPNRAVPYSKMCKEYLTLGDRTHGFPACAAAISRNGASVDDYAQYVGLVLASAGKLPEKMVASLDIVTTRLQAMPPGTAGVDEILCSIGVRTNNVELLNGCVPGLVARSPNDVLTFMAQWTLAMNHGDMATAREVIERARTAGIAPETIAQLESQIALEGPRRTRGTVLGVVMVVLLIVALVALAVLIRGARKLPTDADLHRAEPAADDAGETHSAQGAGEAGPGAGENANNGASGPAEVAAGDTHVTETEPPAA